MPALGIDQGTTGTKGVLLFPDGTHQVVFTARHAQSHPAAGWVEHDAEELLAHISGAIEAAGEVAAIGLANQGETVVAFDAQTGRPIHPAIVWMDARAEPTIQRLRAEGAEAVSLARAGLPLDSYFSAGKLGWIMETVPEARVLLAQGRLRLGTSDAFFLFRLTGSFATDLSTASRTGLLNLTDETWDETLCGLYGVPPETLPRILSSDGAFGLATGVPVTASLVDQQAALFGHGCRGAGALKFTFGTGGFALAVTGEAPVHDAVSGLLTTVAWRRGAVTTYALDGGLYHAASALDWARSVGLFADHAEIDDFAGPTALERGLVFVPALTGLGCPHWDRGATGLFIGLGLGTTRQDMARAVLEGVALRAAEVLEAMGTLIALPDVISIDGGLSRNRYFCRFLARVLGRAVTVFDGEAAALGAALMAMEGAGLAAPALQSVVGAQYEPEAPLAATHRDRFTDAVRRARGWG
ncbi:FGGY family carbohydrate kinase [Acidisoma cladoniae]|jgi:glycerol kinase|uniref:FGGY family carbohydrate kinase n=1 Tax=Acidisoma cladoniae TaxID=3040935 RepID=UPI0025519E5A|nr:FGGY family carbohydrate kinase [Acidisoma sp. PAMC 29798]